MIRIVASIIFCSFLYVSQAQVDFYGGVTLGALTSQVHGDSHQGFYKIGITGGAFVDLEYSRSFGTKLEILYTQKGSRNAPDTLNFSYYKLRLNYIEIPIHAMINIKDWVLNVGPYFGLLIAQAEDYGSGFTGLGEQYLYNDLDIGGHIGASYFITEKTYVNIRYTQSLVPMRPPPENASQANYRFYDASGYNYALHFLAGFRF